MLQSSYGTEILRNYSLSRSPGPFSLTHHMFMLNTSGETPSPPPRFLLLSGESMFNQNLEPPKILNQTKLQQWTQVPLYVCVCLSLSLSVRVFSVVELYAYPIHKPGLSSFNAYGTLWVPSFSGAAPLMF